ncbi:MAG: hypothetical protein RLZZ15_1496, partial [Verrucomicrobiota bacterium]
ESAALERERLLARLRVQSDAMTKAILDRYAKPTDGATATRVEGALRPAANAAALAAESDAEFNRAHAERFTRLRELGARLQAEALEFARAHTDPATGQPYELAALLRAIQSANLKFDQAAREDVTYGDYRTAMLTPGLSPEQRRLLFSAAVAGLAQPLPRGELTPTGQSPRPSGP